MILRHRCNLLDGKMLCQKIVLHFCRVHSTATGCHVLVQRLQISVSV